MRVALREVEEADLGALFEQQRDPAAVRMAAFTSKDPDDRGAFERHWRRVSVAAGFLARTVLADDRVAGSIFRFVEGGRPEVTYWIGREFWGKGVATDALAGFLRLATDRPLYARAAKDNLGSIRVLEKCGFAVVAEERGFANARGSEIDEVLLVLRGA
jgi:RimJ/RimL family protein N-acetyltransferase